MAYMILRETHSSLKFSAEYHKKKLKECSKLLRIRIYLKSTIKSIAKHRETN